MSKLTEEEKEALEEELLTCRNNLKVLNEDLQAITKLKKERWSEFVYWRDKFNFIDRKLAFDSKLVIMKKGSSGKERNYLKSILKDKEKLKGFIEMLEEGIKGNS